MNTDGTQMEDGEARVRIFEKITMKGTKGTKGDLKWEKIWDGQGCLKAGSTFMEIDEGRLLTSLDTIFFRRRCLLLFNLIGCTLDFQLNRLHT